MKHVLLLFACTLSLLIIRAQSISGNLNSASTNAYLGYGNVDIYKGDKLVASVLTDKLGNFNVSLDTGTYKCVVNYSGYKTETRTIRVRSDEKADFKIAEDPSKPRFEPSPSTEMREAERKAFGEAPVGLHFATPVMDGDGIGRGRIGYDDYFKEGVPQMGGSSGKLTAGEINDFSKWKQWQDIAATELTQFQTTWNIAPKGRYTLSLHTPSGIPLADALVHLRMRDGRSLFSSRTDNTGKAELWLTIRNEVPVIDGGLYLDIEYKGMKIPLKHVKPFEQEINHLNLDISCEQSQNVDVAFVVDATGSMGDELSYLQAEMNEIIYQTKQISNSLNFRFANVFYRDLGANELYTTRKMDFNRILSESVSYITQQSAGGGGDYEEAVETALDTAINSLSWSEEARARILFLILDAPPHNNPEIQSKLERLIRQAAAKGIRIVPIGASGINKSTEYLMRSLALGTNGTYTFLTDHSGIGNPHIAPSTDKFDVELLSQVLVRILKSYTYMPDCQQQLPELQLTYPDSLVVYPTDSADTVTPQLTPNDSIPDPTKIRWSYYPNPTDGVINIVADIDIKELYITDLSGKVLQVLNNLEKGRVTQVDLSAYATGIYLIRYPVGKSWLSGKVVLQRLG